MAVSTFLTKTLSLRMARKVPEVIVYFWVVKVLTTAMGEATPTTWSTISIRSSRSSSALSALPSPSPSSFRRNAICAWVYWLAVAMVAIFGTMAADVVHIVLGVPYQFSTIAFAIVLALLFTLWYRTEHTLSIHSIDTPRRELFYWATVCTTFALGTATGDMTASDLPPGLSGLRHPVRHPLRPPADRQQTARRQRKCSPSGSPIS